MKDKLTRELTMAETRLELAHAKEECEKRSLEREHAENAELEQRRLEQKQAKDAELEKRRVGKNKF